MPHIRAPWIKCRGRRMKRGRSSSKIKVINRRGKSSVKPELPSGYYCVPSDVIVLAVAAAQRYAGVLAGVVQVFPGLRGDLLPENFSQNGAVELVVSFNHPRLRRHRGQIRGRTLFHCFFFSFSFRLFFILLFNVVLHLLVRVCCIFVFNCFRFFKNAFVIFVVFHSVVQCGFSFALSCLLHFCFQLFPFSSNTSVIFSPVV